MKNLNLDLRGLAFLLDQGEALADALEKIGQRPGSDVWLTAAQKVRSGSTLQDALEALPQWLQEVLAGAPQARLPEILRQSSRLSDQEGQRRIFWRNLVVYPCLVWLVSVLTGGFISFLGVEEARQLSHTLEGGDSLPDRIARAYLSAFPLLLLSPLLMAALLRLQSVRSRLPVVGFLVRLRESAALLRWLELLLEGARPLPEALRSAAARCSVKPLQRQLERLSQSLTEGSDFATAVRQASLLPPLARWTLTQAERHQFQPESLKSMAEILDQKIEFFQSFAAAVLLLSLYAVLGALALWVVVALFLPLMRGGL